MRMVQSEKEGIVLLISSLLLVQSIGSVKTPSGRDANYPPHDAASGVTPGAGVHQSVDDHPDSIHQSTDYSPDPTTQSVPVTEKRHRRSRFKNPHLTPEERKAQTLKRRRAAWHVYSDKMRKDPKRYANYLEKAKESTHKNSYLNKAEKILDPVEKENFLKQARAKQAEKGRKAYYERKQRTGFGSKKDQEHHQRVKALKAGTATVEDILAIQTVRDGARARQAKFKANRSKSNTLQRRNLIDCKRYELDLQECGQGH